ncbi:MAG: lipoyl(octanoyl) transferase LipB, partial [Bacteroidota bacterium]|nr:lipoyl(octanoyl) transferase LipB [Bacteroidota bacterium]
KAYEKQLEIFNKKIKNLKEKKENDNHVFFVEHPHVYTLGKSGDDSNLILPKKSLKEINASYFKTDRGGDITYHGFGQIVIYPILDLSNYSIMVKKYVFSIEEVIIRTLKEYGLFATRLEDAAGVWLLDRPRPEKICALGIRISKGITMHGLAFNINTDLKYFSYINPCGYTDKGVTSMQKELGKEINIHEVKLKIIDNFNDVFLNF